MAHVVHTASAQLKAGLNKRVSGVKNKFENAVDSIESRAEKVGALRHSTLRGQLSFFSVPPEDREDPIPNTNVFLGVLYVLGAVAALSYAMIDTSCEPVTAYREDAPIDTCTEMLASFSCRTADYNRTAGTGFSKIFDKNTCLLAKNTTEEKFGHHPVAQCGSMKEGVFTCQTSDYDPTGVPDNRTAYVNWDMIDIGTRKTFDRFTCPERAPHAATTAVYGAYPAHTRPFFIDDAYRCETADFVAGSETVGAGVQGYAKVLDLNNEYTRSVELTGTYPAEECQSAVRDTDGNDEFTCQTADYDEVAGTGYKRIYMAYASYGSEECPYEMVHLDDGTIIYSPGWVYDDVVGVHPVSASGDFKDGTSYTCQTSDYDEAAGTGFKTDPCTQPYYNSATYVPGVGICPYVEYGRSTFIGYPTFDNISFSECANLTSAVYDPNYMPNVTCQTADYDATSGSGTQKSFSYCLNGYFDMMSNVQRPDGYDRESGLTFANCRATLPVEFELATCEGTVETRVGRLDTCTGRRVKDVEFDTCWGTREIDVEFATCEGTQDVSVTCTFISRPLSLNARR